MPHNSDDSRIDAFLGGYTTPVADNGFTAMVMAKADIEVTRLARLRRRVLNATFFIGGVGAAVQIPKLWGLLQGLSMPNIAVPNVGVADAAIFDMGTLTTTLNSSLGASMTYAAAVGVMVALMMGWAIFADQV